MKIVYIHRASFEKRPPVISAVSNLLSLGHEIVLITNHIDTKNKNIIENMGGIIEIAPYKIHRNKFKAIREVYRYRRHVKKILKEYPADDYILWVEGNYTMIALVGAIDSYNHILQIQELHKNKLHYKAIRKYIKKALLVFMPEYNRSYMYKILFGLKTLPIVLPNKPDFVPTIDELELLKSKYANYFNQINNRKVILYQGLISEERDLSKFMKAFTKLDNTQYAVVLLGQDYNMLHIYRKIYSNIIHIPYIPAPDYLVFTSIAHIGVVTYLGDTLNNAYCAPNKIFEYSAFSVPMIGNNIPGLKYPFLEYKLGEVVDENDDKSIIDAIYKISSNYTSYEENVARLYRETNNKETLRNALATLK